MTVIRGVALFMSVVAAAVLFGASGSATGASATGVRLKISSRVDAKGAALLFEASEPLPYIATQPDPLTVVLDFRSVAVAGVANSFAADAKSPVARVAIESVAPTGTAGSRVRIILVQPVAHRVRSDRNTIVVAFDKPSANVRPYVLAPLASLRPNPSAASGTPDAIQALLVRAVRDPIVALGLNVETRQAPTAGSTATRGPAPPAAFQQTPAAPPPPAPVAAGARFTGHPVSLDFQGADLRAVLRTFAEISGLNMVIDPKVTGTVDVALRDVPWDQALDIILRANGLDFRVDGTIVRIAPREVFTVEDKGRSDAVQAQALAGDLTVMTKTLSYAKAEELVLLLTKSALSSRGTVQVDPRTNTLIISDLSDRLAVATSLITTLDRPQPQVEIEARIVQTNKNYSKALGIQWGFTGRVDPTLGNTTNMAFPNSATIDGRAVGGPAGTAVGLPADGATSAVGLSLGSVNGAFNLDVALTALESHGNARLLSNPRVSTQNNTEAEIAQGVQIPFQTVANNTVTTSFKDAALVLKVTPQITAAGTVILKIIVDNGSVGPSFGGVPSINTQRANTTVLVSDGQTTVLGGIYSSSETSTTDRTPGLGTIPLLRWLFKRDSLSDQNSELLIFITPRIIKG
jgi:type IV pilus assembly protein PilQ